MGELDGKVALVVGATRRRGLGRAIALTLARDGADVVVTGTGRPPSEFPEDEQREGWRGAPEVAEQCAALGVRSHACVLDVTSGEDVQATVAETAAHMGRIDILVNNATYARGADRVPLQDLDDDLWRRIIDVNLTGTMLCSKYVARQMIAQGDGGSIVSISSVAGVRGGANTAAYATTKGALHVLTGSLAAELAGHGITANVVAPGFIDTARIDELREGDRWQRRLRTIPMSRAGTAEEVAETVRYLCGPSTRWLTGQTIYVDGGETR
ncbi:MAG: SDR family oxidoreductase [Dehalococcoidia bacterium]|jgi:NAD(P)-dependent dehydrogenase (short-subunit alcohol dehydrogenase family)|nr:SDR family oxidoreductase [Dehalococcoidia bacterium]